MPRRKPYERRSDHSQGTVSPGTVLLKDMSENARKVLRAQVIADFEAALKLAPGTLERDREMALDPLVARARIDARLKRMEKETKWFWSTDYSDGYKRS